MNMKWKSFRDLDNNKKKKNNVGSALRPVSAYRNIITLPALYEYGQPRRRLNAFWLHRRVHSGLIMFCKQMRQKSGFYFVQMIELRSVGFARGTHFIFWCIGWVTCIHGRSDPTQRIGRIKTINTATPTAALKGGGKFCSAPARNVIGARCSRTVRA